jgi:hypothetical protein
MRLLLCLVLALFSLDARAVVPRFVGAPVVDNPRFDGVANTMMYTVTATVDGTGSDADHTAVVGFVPEADYAGCGGTAWKWSRAQTFDSAPTRTWTLYNFLPGTKYYYRVRVGTGATARSRCGVLETTAAPTPTLPEELGYLDVRFTKSGAAFDTKYVLVESDDCGASGGSFAGATNYLVVVDAVNEAIVWYLDVPATAGLAGGSGSGFRYHRGASPTSATILMTVSHRYVFEWGFDGATLHSYDFGESSCDGSSGAEGPCFHHDVTKSATTGNTYALAALLTPTDMTGTVWEDTCGVDARFVDDGVQVLDDAFALTDSITLMDEGAYDPVVDPGPNGERSAMRATVCEGDTWTRLLDAPDGMVDWLHANSVDASTVAGREVVDVSLKEWDQVVRFDASTGDVLWRLSSRPEDSDWGTLTMAAGLVGSATFADQHDVHAIGPNTLLMLDNQGERAGARALQIRLNNGRPRSAVIEKSWAVVSGSGGQLNCDTEGTAELVPDSDNVLAVCAGIALAVELDDPTGESGTEPPLTISLPDGDPQPFCSVGGPDERSTIRGWRRAFPIERVGEF